MGKRSKVLHCLFAPSEELELRQCIPAFSKGCSEWASFKGEPLKQPTVAPPQPSLYLLECLWHRIFLLGLPVLDTADCTQMHQGWPSGRRPKGNPSPGWAHSVLSIDKQGSEISELMVGLETRGHVELGSEFLP